MITLAVRLKLRSSCYQFSRQTRLVHPSDTGAEVPGSTLHEQLGSLSEKDGTPRHVHVCFGRAKAPRYKFSRNGRTRLPEVSDDHSSFLRRAADDRKGNTDCREHFPLSIQDRRAKNNRPFSRLLVVDGEPALAHARQFNPEAGAVSDGARCETAKPRRAQGALELLGRQVSSDRLPERRRVQGALIANGVAKMQGMRSFDPINYGHFPLPQLSEPH